MCHFLIREHIAGRVGRSGDAQRPGFLAGGKVGKIHVIFKQVLIEQLDGRSGGGEVLIGGDYQGQGDTQTATQTQISRGSSIHADAIDSGNGGKVIVWADDFTIFDGEATARGGSQSGDGGFIEISGNYAGP